MTKYWVQDTGNWSDSANHWSNSSGGAPGAGEPGNEPIHINSASAAAAFTITLDKDTNTFLYIYATACDDNYIIDTNGFNWSSYSYNYLGNHVNAIFYCRTGTHQFGSVSYTADFGLFWYVGTFYGDSATINAASIFNYTNMTSTSGVMTITYYCTYGGYHAAFLKGDGGATFAHNNGTIHFSAAVYQDMKISNWTLYNLTCAGTSSVNVIESFNIAAGGSIAPETNGTFNIPTGITITML
jgi:hypothetical protein